MWELVCTQMNSLVLSFTFNSEFMIETNCKWGFSVDGEEDNMGDTAITFIFLFLLTLLLSIGTTAFKVQIY